MFLRSGNFIQSGGQTESRYSIEESVNQPSRLEMIWEGSYVSDTSFETNMSTHTSDLTINRNNGAGISMKFTMFLDFVKENDYGAQVYEDPLGRFAVKVEDRPTEHKLRPSANYQEDRYVDTDGVLYLVVQDYEKVDKWGQPVDTRVVETPEAPPNVSRLAGFRVINSPRVRRVPIADNPNTTLYYRDDEDGSRFFYQKEFPFEV